MRLSHNARALACAFLMASTTSLAIAQTQPLQGAATAAQTAAREGVVQQFGMPLALMNNIYEGARTVKEMGAFGDMGLGTANQMEGELVALDGVVYAIDPDGGISVAPDNTQAPYMTMVRFRPTQTVVVEHASSLAELTQVLKAHMPSPNSLYALKIHGRFTSLRMASAKKIENDNIPLFQYLATRKMYTEADAQGTLVGLYTPDYLGNISIPGLHFHYLSDDKKLGGHLEDIELTQMTVELQEINQIHVNLPLVDKFRTTAMKQVEVAPATGGSR